MRAAILYDNKNDTLRFAAGELSDYLQKICPELEIALMDAEAENRIYLTVKRELINEIRPRQEKPDAQLDDVMDISVTGLSGRIAGSNPRAVLLGVYRYLYRLGCRFLRPGREYETLPAFTQVGQFDASDSIAADKRHRGVCIEGADSLENILDFIDWLPKLGFNSFFLQFQNPHAFLERWYNHTNNPFLRKEPFGMELSERLTDNFREEMNKRGILQHWVGHGWTCETLGRSALGWVESGAVIPETFREFPALLNGKREFYRGIPINTNLCYSNPAVIRRFADLVADYAQAHIDVDYLHVWQADDYNNQCECEKCREKSPTDLYIHLLNKIDEQLRLRTLSTRIVFLLYMDLLWPPIQEKLNNPERFVMMFAPISRVFRRSYRERKELQPIPDFCHNQIRLPSGLEENLAFLKEWQKGFKEDSFVYDYHLGRAHYGDLGYVGISKILYEDIRTLDELSLNGLIACQELRAALPNALPDYVMGLSLMDADLSFEEIAEDYYSHAYGREWKNILSYLTGLSSLCDWDYFNGKGARGNAKVAADMEKAVGLLERQAVVLKKKAPEENEVVQRFYRHLVYHNSYARLLASAVRRQAEGNSGPAEEAWNEFVSFIRKNEPDFQQCLDVYRVIEVSMNYAGFPKE